MTQLVESRARLDLGADVQVARVRTTAAAGSEVLGWLASADEVVSEEVADAARSWLAAAGPA